MFWIDKRAGTGVYKQRSELQRQFNCGNFSKLVQICFFLVSTVSFYMLQKYFLVAKPDGVCTAAGHNCSKAILGEGVSTGQKKKKMCVQLTSSLSISKLTKDIAVEIHCPWK